MAKAPDGQPGPTLRGGDRGSSGHHQPQNIRTGSQTDLSRKDHHPGGRAHRNTAKWAGNKGNPYNAKYISSLCGSLDSTTEHQCWYFKKKSYQRENGDGEEASGFFSLQDVSSIILFSSRAEY